jgi:hypothetical protein
MIVRFLVHLSGQGISNTSHTVLVDSWEQCKDADVLLESPSAMAGVHIAEALREQFHYAFSGHR